MDTHKILYSLRDIPGVYGSFIVNMSGSMVNRDFPVSLSNASINAAGPKLCRLWDSLVDPKAEYINLIFKFHIIHVRRFKYGMMCVYIPPRVNMLTLAGASQIATRALDELSEDNFIGYKSKRKNTSTNTTDLGMDSIIYRGLKYGAEELQASK